MSGAVLRQVFGAAQDRGLALCPPTTGPYLRLALHAQSVAPDAVMSNGRAPSGTHRCRAPLQVDEDYPKGVLLRVITGQPWLRGYHCGSGEHVLGPNDRFVFRCPAR